MVVVVVVVCGDTRTQNWGLATPRPFWTVATIAEVGQNSDPLLSLAQPSSVPKKEREIRGVDFIEVRGRHSRQLCKTISAE